MVGIGQRDATLRLDPAIADALADGLYKFELQVGGEAEGKAPEAIGTIYRNVRKIPKF